MNRVDYLDSIMPVKQPAKTKKAKPVAVTASASAAMADEVLRGTAHVATIVGAPSGLDQATLNEWSDLAAGYQANGGQIERDIATYTSDAPPAPLPWYDIARLRPYRDVVAAVGFGTMLAGVAITSPAEALALAGVGLMVLAWWLGAGGPR